MPSYFFDLNECGDHTRSEEALEHDSMEAVHATAVRAARDIMREELSVGRLCLSCRIEVRDEHGETVLKVRFKDAVTITGM